MDTIILQQSDPIVLEVATMVLSIDFNVVPFEQFPASLTDVISSYSPKLIIVDFILEDQEAIAYLKEIRKIEPNLPVIALSCNNDIAIAAKSNGFDGYICKPFDIATLVNTVKVYMNEFYEKKSRLKNVETFNHSY